MDCPPWKNTLKWVQTLGRAFAVLVGIAGLAFIILFVYWEGSLTWKGISTTFTFVLGNVAALIAIVLTAWEMSPMIAHLVINKWKADEQAKGQAQGTARMGAAARKKQEELGRPLTDKEWEDLEKEILNGSGPS